MAISITACTTSFGKNGEVEMTLKNSQPCFYINNKDFKGDYRVIITIPNQATEYIYESNYQTNYPNKQNCIIYNNINFQNYEPLREYFDYSITIYSEKQSKRKPASSHENNFCLIRENGQLTIIEPEYNCQLYKN